MASGYYQLPGYRVPDNAMLNMKPLNDAITGYKQAQTDNVMAQYQADRDRATDQRQNAMLSLQQQAGARQQKQFDAQQEKEAIGQLAGIYQQINAAPEADRPALYQRFQPTYDRLRSRFKDFDSDLTAAGIDPSDHAQVSRIIMGMAAGYQNPLETQKTQAEINLKNAQAGYYNERPRTVAGGATTALIDRLMQENPNMSLEEAITIAKRGSGITIVGDQALNRNTAEPVRNVGSALAGGEIAKGEGQNVAKVRAGLPEAKQRLTMITGGLDRIEQTARSLAGMEGLDSVVGGLYQAYAPNVSEKALNAQTELENLKVKISGVVLQSMRDASKTGGAVGQVTEREWPRLENMISNLDPRQGKEQFLRNLQQVVEYAQGVKSALQQAYEEDLSIAGQGQPSPAAAPQQDGWQDLGGVRIRVKPAQ